MFKLLPKVQDGEVITIVHKRREYSLLSADKLRKLRLLDALSDLPKFSLNRDDIRGAIEEGRS
jgi:hypothetical protein